MPGDKVVVLEDVPMEPQAEAEAEEDKDDEMLFVAETKRKSYKDPGTPGSCEYRNRST